MPPHPHPATPRSTPAPTRTYECQCSVSDRCPQGRTGFSPKCLIVVKEPMAIVQNVAGNPRDADGTAEQDAKIAAERPVGGPAGLIVPEPAWSKAHRAIRMTRIAHPLVDDTHPTDLRYSRKILGGLNASAVLNALDEAGLELRARNEELEPGDVVELKSGSRRMTVSGHVNNDPLFVHAVWFDPNSAVLINGNFAASALRRCAP